MINGLFPPTSKPQSVRVAGFLSGVYFLTLVLKPRNEIIHKHVVGNAKKVQTNNEQYIFQNIFNFQS